MRGAVLIICLGIFVGLGASESVAQQERDGASKGSVNFNIPAQTLDDSLNAFGDTTGLQIFYESSLTLGRRSTEVQGVFDPPTALQLLLLGSGLSARFFATGAVSIVASPAAVLSAERQAKRAYLPYYGSLQAGVMTALCASAATRPGPYHVVLRYWLDPSGRIARSELIGSSGSALRDAAIIGALRTVTLPPPGDMPQPVTVAIEPAGPEELADCVPRGTETSRVP